MAVFMIRFRDIRVRLQHRDPAKPAGARAVLPGVIQSIFAQVIDRHDILNSRRSAALITAQGAGQSAALPAPGKKGRSARQKAPLGPIERARRISVFFRDFRLMTGIRPCGAAVAWDIDVKFRAQHAPPHPQASRPARSMSALDLFAMLNAPLRGTAPVRSRPVSLTARPTAPSPACWP
ncbi:hypothetical protein [Brevundimonas denitrificans]|uniref:hypothetical protein n=1 Tax=Brevundimonas denitrificans TaxID=1443434 RepID=UPI00223AADB6|nr:hypothetical protein [Brevundimonas denitrificans]